jgi:hypothetical protein
MNTLGEEKSYREVHLMKALVYGILGLALVCLTFGPAEASQVRPEAASYPSEHEFVQQPARPADLWVKNLEDARSEAPPPEVRLAFDFGAALRGFSEGNVNYYGYRPFGYLGYQSDAYRGYRPPGYYGYRYYFQYPVYNPGFRFDFRL